jgi:hypothetical protein
VKTWCVVTSCQVIHLKPTLFSLESLKMDKKEFLEDPINSSWIPKERAIGIKTASVFAIN